MAGCAIRIDARRDGVDEMDAFALLPNLVVVVEHGVRICKAIAFRDRVTLAFRLDQICKRPQATAVQRLLDVSARAATLPKLFESEMKTAFFATRSISATAVSGVLM